MALNRILLLSFLMIATSCRGQEKTNTLKEPLAFNTLPTVIKKTKAAALAPDFDTTLVSQYIRSIFQDSKGNLWFGTIGEGVVRYDKKTFTYFSNADGFMTNSVFAINEDKNGNIWFASADKGVFRYDGKTIVNFNEKEGLGENYAGGIAQDPVGNMWFTMKNGICKFDGKTFTEYTPKDGLGGTEFWRILIEQSGIVWITARGSTTRFDPSVPQADPNAFSVFTSTDGFTCCVQSMFQDKSGTMWWGTGQGLYRFSGTRFYQVKQIGPW